jgi:hypothetical protein
MSGLRAVLTLTLGNTIAAFQCFSTLTAAHATATPCFGIGGAEFDEVVVQPDSTVVCDPARGFFPMLKAVEIPMAGRGRAAIMKWEPNEPSHF